MIIKTQHPVNNDNLPIMCYNKRWLNIKDSLRRCRDVAFIETHLFDLMMCYNKRRLNIKDSLRPYRDVAFIETHLFDLMMCYNKR